MVIPRLGLDLLPDFENYRYQIAIAPTGARVSAWSKLRECERRLVMFEWVESLTDSRKAQHRILLDDTVSAFLLAFEATLQFLRDQFASCANAPDFWPWLSQQSEYDVVVRGLGTLRHLEAHVESKPLRSAIDFNVSASSVSRVWQLKKLEPADLDRLTRSRLEEAELETWNAIVDSDVKDVIKNPAARPQGMQLQKP